MESIDRLFVLFVDRLIDQDKGTPLLLVETAAGWVQRVKEEEKSLADKRHLIPEDGQPNQGTGDTKGRGRLTVYSRIKVSC